MVFMSALKDRLRADLTTAIKARDELRSSTIRMVLTAITNAEVAGKEARELSDDDVIGVLSTEAKRRREAAVAFQEAGRTEMAAKEAAEGEVIADYLPAQLGDAEIADLVAAAKASAASRRFLASVLSTPTMSSSDSSRCSLPATSAFVIEVNSIRRVEDRRASRAFIDAVRSVRSRSLRSLTAPVCQPDASAARPRRRGSLGVCRTLQPPRHVPP